MQNRSLGRMLRVLAAIAMAVAGTASAAGPAAAEFYTTRVFLDRETDDQIAYVVGLIDMYEFARKDFAADPDDWLVPCLNRQAAPDITTFFVDWLLLDPASWRFSPARLFIDAMDELCN